MPTPVFRLTVHEGTEHDVSFALDGENLVTPLDEFEFLGAFPLGILDVCSQPVLHFLGLYLLLSGAALLLALLLLHLVQILVHGQETALEVETGFVPNGAASVIEHSLLLAL
jgi:hypothetical protein